MPKVSSDQRNPAKVILLENIELPKNGTLIIGPNLTYVLAREDGTIITSTLQPLSN